MRYEKLIRKVMKIAVIIFLLQTNCYILSAQCVQEEACYAELEGDNGLSYGTQGTSWEFWIIMILLLIVLYFVIKALRDRAKKEKKGIIHNHAIQFCPYCGKPVEGNSNFCEYCGEKL